MLILDILSGYWLENQYSTYIDYIIVVLIKV